VGERKISLIPALSAANTRTNPRSAVTPSLALAVSFFLAILAVLEMEEIKLEDLRKPLTD